MKTPPQTISTRKSLKSLAQGRAAVGFHLLFVVLASARCGAALKALESTAGRGASAQDIYSS